MISPEQFVNHLQTLGVSMFVGVPDSLLKPFTQYVSAELPRSNHIIAANEGAAVGLAIGHYLRTEKPALVYMQNSGIGNAVNPLLSLADSDVYGVPMVLVVGWRGQPGLADEPQHKKQGRVMQAMVAAMELPYAVLPTNPAEAMSCMANAIATATDQQCPYVVFVEKGTFASASTSPAVDSEIVSLPTREAAVDSLKASISADAIIVSTTGMLSRELFELRENDSTDSTRDFLTVGGMGHASAIALGIAQSEPHREVWCFDGDGATIMHMGTMVTIADQAPQNFFHAVFNNGVHDSVGGQPTSINVVDLPKVALSVGYRGAMSSSSCEDLQQQVEAMRQLDGPSLLEIKVKPGARSDLGRPTRTPQENKLRFVKAIGQRV